MVGDADDTTDRREWLATAAIGLLFALIATLVAFDVLSDLGAGASARHVIVEGAVIALGASGALFMALRLAGQVRRARALAAGAADLARDLAAARAEAVAWKQEAADLITGLGGAIDRQLARWGLSAAEKDVALLLLKGLSHKEVATLRQVAETTVRQQARALYKKAGLGGRADLAAFFLEDLLGPRGAA